MIYLYIAFSIVWIVLIVYVINIFGLRKALNNELNALETLK